MAKKQALGKGLGALIKTQGIGSNITGPGNQKSGPGTHENDVRNVPIGQIIASPLQPRKHFTEGMLDDLMESIAQHGIIQPLIVREVEGEFELIAGERRWRASSNLGLKTVPVIIRKASDRDEKRNHPASG